MEERDYTILLKISVNFCAIKRKNANSTFTSFKKLDYRLHFALQMHERDDLPSHMLRYIPPLRKGVVSMRVVVVKFPKALCGLMRKIFHMD